MDEFVPCAVCARTPLIGEHVAVMSAGERECSVCELCRRSPRAATLGEPIRRERVRSAAGAANVRRARPQPVPAPLRVEAASAA